VRYCDVCGRGDVGRCVQNAPAWGCGADICHWGAVFCCYPGAVLDNEVPCSSEEFDRKAKRTKNSVLINTKTGPMHQGEAGGAEVGLCCDRVVYL